MSVAFGTSGLRGLVSLLSDDLIGAYTRAFLATCPSGLGLFVGRDLRSSSLRISQTVMTAAREFGVDVTDCGLLPTPALALAAMTSGAAAVMVTGSHIPDDRNGLKFYTPMGEISKLDEGRISAALHSAEKIGPSKGKIGTWTDGAQARADFIRRYVQAFGPQALAGLRVGIYQHSSAARDILVELVAQLGGQPLPFARADQFIPVDTEALDAQTRAQLAHWAADLRLDAIFSTDGDADRPMLADGTGRVIAGDALGVLTAQALGAEVICTPVSSNSQIEAIAGFQTVIRCKIGSPFVIWAMQQALDNNAQARVAGFEANGGFLLGYAAQGPQGLLAPLMTRDAMLPLIAPLARAKEQGRSLSEALTALQLRKMASDRLTNIPAPASAAFLAQMQQDKQRAAFLAPFGAEATLNKIDGLRMTLTDGRIVHLRPSGNAPEFRIYVEAADEAGATRMLAAVMEQVAQALNSLGANA